MMNKGRQQKKRENRKFSMKLFLEFFSFIPQLLPFQVKRISFQTAAAESAFTPHRKDMKGAVRFFFYLF